MPYPHDDHIWITVGGKAWAIHHIDHHPTEPFLPDDPPNPPYAPRMYLWRGYWPFLEINILDTSQMDYELYCFMAVEFMDDYELMKEDLRRIRRPDKNTS